MFFFKGNATKCNWTEKSAKFVPMAISCPSDSYMNGLKIQPIRESAKTNKAGTDGPKKSDEEWGRVVSSYFT